MKRHVTPAGVLIIIALSHGGAAAAPRLPEATIARHLGAYASEGCFLLGDRSGKPLIRFGGRRCDEPLPPCSTFKVPNAMFGVDAGVVGPETRFAWDRRKQPIKSWERDHTLTTAFRESVVWYFQRLATLVGQARMERYLRALGYGNQRVGGHLTTFWLDGTLTITARQQLALLAALYRDTLPVSARARQVARQLMHAGADDPMGGKTGTCGRIAGSVGWFIGHVRPQGSASDYVFVTMIRSKAGAFTPDGASGPKAKQMARELLRAAKLL